MLVRSLGAGVNLSRACAQILLLGLYFRRPLVRLSLLGSYLIYDFSLEEASRV